MTVRRELKYIPLPADSVKLQLTIEKLRNLPLDTLYKTASGRASLSIHYRRDTILIDCGCDSITMQAEYYEEQFHKLEQQHKQQTDTPWLQWGCIAAIAIMLTRR